MPAPVLPADFHECIPGSTLSGLCEKIKLTWLRLPDILSQLVTYMFDASGNPSPDFVRAIAVTTSPPGTIVMYAGSNAPAGWLECNGGSVARASYPELFAAIGTTYGTTGASFFSLPLMNDRFPIGKSASRPLANTGGAETVTIPGYEDHTHVTGRSTNASSDDNFLFIFGTPASPDSSAIGRFISGDSNFSTAALSTVTGPYTVTSKPVDLATDEVSIVPPYIALLFIIKT
jgi:microcystin-dependent protein